MLILKACLNTVFDNSLWYLLPAFTGFHFVCITPCLGGWGGGGGGGWIRFDNEFETKGNKMKPRMRLLIIMNHSSI